MVLKDNNRILSEDFELLHKPNNDLKWRESYYFNWADFKNKIQVFLQLEYYLMIKKENLFLFFSWTTKWKFIIRNTL